MLQSPYVFRLRSKVLLYSHRLREIVLSHDRRSNASLGALPNMLLSRLAFAAGSGGCPRSFALSFSCVTQEFHMHRHGAQSHPGDHLAPFHTKLIGLYMHEIELTGFHNTLMNAASSACPHDPANRPRFVHPAPRHEQSPGSDSHTKEASPRS